MFSVSLHSSVPLCSPVSLCLVTKVCSPGVYVPRSFVPGRMVPLSLCSRSLCFLVLMTPLPPPPNARSLSSEALLSLGPRSVSSPVNPVPQFPYLPGFYLSQFLCSPVTSFPVPLVRQFYIHLPPPPTDLCVSQSLRSLFLVLYVSQFNIYPRSSFPLFLSLPFLLFSTPSVT